MADDDDSATAKPASASKPRPPSYSSSQLPLPILNKATIALQPSPQSVTMDSSPSFALPTSIQTTSLATPTTNPFFGNERDEDSSRTPNSLPIRLHKSTHSSPSSAGSLRRDRNRPTRRSADVLQHLKFLEDEVKSRGQDSLAPRETKKAAITTDDVGGLVNVNQYAIIKDLGRGAFAEVKLCKHQVDPISPDPARADLGIGLKKYPPLVSGAGSPKGAGFGGDASALTTSPFFSSSAPTTPTSRVMTPSPTAVGNSEELYAIKIFSKSLLLRRRQFIRSREGRLNVTTDLDKVQREIAIMKKLVHPHLVKLYEVIDDASHDALYLVLEYVEGGQIMEFDAEKRRYISQAHAESGGTLGEVEAARVLGDMLAGLAYLHVHHIAHRDLKPENVLVGRGGRCKIADFGVAHFFEEDAARVLALTNARVAVGTEREEGGKGGKGAACALEGEGGMEERQLHQLYRSTSRGLLNKSDGTWSFWAPEMCRLRGGGGGGGSFSGYSCDVWSAGVCLWVFVFGTLPFQEESPEELFEAIREKDFVFPWLVEGGEGRQGGREVSVELQDLLRQFLHKIPGDRITVGDALDHPWSQLADERGVEEGSEGEETGVEEEEEEEGDGGWKEATARVGLPPPPGTPSGHRSTLRSRAYSFRKVHVTPDEIDSAIKSVNNFVLVNKLKKQLTQKLREARASLSRVYSPATSPTSSPSVSPDHSRSTSNASPMSCPAMKSDNNVCSSSPTSHERRPSISPSSCSFLPPAILSALSSGGSGANSTKSEGRTSPFGCCSPSANQKHKKNGRSVGESGVDGSVRASISTNEGSATPSSPSHSSTVNTATSEEGREGREHNLISSSLIVIPKDDGLGVVAPVPVCAVSTPNSSNSSSSRGSGNVGLGEMSRRSPKPRLRTTSKSRAKESCSLM